jgi:hypothetical protein
MRFFPIEYLSHSLTLVGRKSRDIYERSDPLVFCPSNDRSGVSVPSQQHRTFSSLKNAI